MTTRGVHSTETPRAIVSTFVVPTFVVPIDVSTDVSTVASKSGGPRGIAIHQTLSFNVTLLENLLTSY